MDADRLDARLRATVAIVALDPCCLCHDHSDMVGVFSPGKERATEFGAPPGKERMIFYPICSACLESPEAQERIETVLRGSRFNVMQSVA